MILLMFLNACVLFGPIPNKDVECRDGSTAERGECPEDQDDSGEDSDDTAETGAGETIDTACAAEEVCNGVDDDCDGYIDNVMQAAFFRDRDLDTFGDPEESLVGWSCQAPSGYVDNPDDCDDTDPETYPGHGC